MDLLVTCTCGHQITVSEYAAGMTAPCPKCGKPLTVGPQNSKPIERAPAPSIESRPPASPIPSIQAHAIESLSTSPTEIIYTPIQTTSLKTHCARCGKEFRGDWDRHPSAIGLVCNICRNLIKPKDAPESSGYVPPIDTIKLDPQIDTNPYDPVEAIEEKWYEKYRPDRAMMQRIAIGAAVAFGMYTLWLLISGAWVVGPEPTGHHGAEVAPQDIHALPAWASIAVRILSSASMFVSSIAGLYIFLTLSKRLPEETLLANVIRMMPAAAIITVLYFAASVLPFGFIIAVLLVPAVIFVSFGFEAQDVINLPLGMVLGGILQSLCYLLIYGAIATIAL